MKLRSAVLLLSLAAVALGAAASPPTVVVFGDSITQGRSLPETQKDELWTFRIQRELADRIVLVNEGRGGRPTDSLSEFDAMLARHLRVDQLVIALGANDARDTGGQCVPKAVANLRTMIRRAREVHGAGLPVLLVGPPNINKDALGPTKPIANEREQNLKDLTVAFESLAREEGCGFVGLFGVVPPESLTRDGVHPDGPGNEPIARTILPRLLAAPR